MGSNHGLPVRRTGALATELAARCDVPAVGVVLAGKDSRPEAGVSADDDHKDDADHSDRLVEVADNVDVFLSHGVSGRGNGSG